MAAVEGEGAVLFAALVAVEEEAALVTVEEEAALGLENMVAVEEEGAVAVQVTAEEEGAVAALAAAEEEGVVAALVDVEVWFGTPKSSVRRLLVLRLLDNKLEETFLLLLGMFRKKTLEKTKSNENETSALHTLVRKTGLKPVLTGSMSDLQVFGGDVLTAYRCLGDVLVKEGVGGIPL